MQFWRETWTFAGARRLWRKHETLGNTVARGSAQARDHRFLRPATPPDAMAERRDMTVERILMGLLLGGVAIGCVLVLYPFFSALLWAGILVYTTWPVFQWLRLHLHLKRMWAAGLMVTQRSSVEILPMPRSSPTIKESATFSAA